MIRILLIMSVRERVMLAAFIAVCLLIWATKLSDRWTETSQELNLARREAQLQKTWLDNSAFFQAQLDRSMSRVEADRMLSPNQLSALVDSYAREHELRHELPNPTVTAGTVFSRATLRMNFRNISFHDLLRFHFFILEHHPYVALEGVAIIPNRADPRLLNARLRMSAIQIHETTVN